MTTDQQQDHWDHETPVKQSLYQSSFQEIITPTPSRILKVEPSLISQIISTDQLQKKFKEAKRNENSLKPYNWCWASILSFVEYIVSFLSRLSLEPSVVAVIMIVSDIKLGPNLNLVLFKSGYCPVKGVDHYILLLKRFKQSRTVYSQYHQKLTTDDS